MSLALAPARRRLQYVIASRAGRLQPGLLVNSVPKSGTHLAKAILQGAGLRFTGHLGAPELGHLRLRDGGDGFATAHVSAPVTGPGRRLLVLRDPVDVAVSMAIYIRTRADHPRRAALAGLDLDGAVQAIFTGTGNLEPLADRFRAMGDWARASQAEVIDFAAFRADPATLLAASGREVRPAQAASIRRRTRLWNPTKRSRAVPGEAELKAALRGSAARPIRDAFDAYEEIKSRP